MSSQSAADNNWAELDILSTRNQFISDGGALDLIYRALFAWSSPTTIDSRWRFSCMSAPEMLRNSLPMPGRASRAQAAKLIIADAKCLNVKSINNMSHADMFPFYRWRSSKSHSRVHRST